MYVIMATYKIKADIIVYGARSQKDAVNELQIMLNDYDDMNEGNTSICINCDNVVKIVED